MRTSDWKAISLPLGAAVACSLTSELDSFKGNSATANAGGVGAESASTGGGWAAASSTGGQDAGAEAAAPASATFSDSKAGDFAAGSHQDTAYMDGWLALQAGKPNGTFLSRLFDAQGSAVWKTIAWEPEAPYEKPLPAEAKAETGYTRGSVDMANNILLLHLDGAGTVAHGSLIPEYSGLAHSPTAWGPGAPLSHGDALIGEGLTTTESNYYYVDVQPGSPFSFSQSSFTWALWVNTAQSNCDDKKTYLGVENDLGQHLWFGCKTSAKSSSCCSGPGRRVGGTFRTSMSPLDSTCYCSNAALSDSTWHHVALVKSGHAQAELKIYVDGVADTVTPAKFMQPIGSTKPTRFTIGAFTFYPPSQPSHVSAGTFDEIAVWRRALAKVELSAIHRRGRLRLRFQVRVCSDAQCTDNPPFVGPDGSASSYFFDGRDGPGVDSPQGLPALTGRYFQYRASFETLLPEETPRLKAVTLTAQLQLN